MEEIVLANPETTYCSATPLEHRKRYAQFFTPAEIAASMAQWLLRNPRLDQVLDPAIGLGIFARALREAGFEGRVHGFEVDRRIHTEALHLFETDSRIGITLQDYLSSDWFTRYDGIICNPPYFKFHDYDNKPALEQVKKQLGIELSGFSNLYSLFLLKAINQLADNGRAAFLVPSEFLNADYGRFVKRALLQSGALREVIVFDFSANVFDGALTTASLILLAKDAGTGHVHFSTIHDPVELLHVASQVNASEAQVNVIRVQDIDPDIKWRNYYAPFKGREFRNLSPFAHYAKVSRGIATGDNDYFVFNQTRADMLAIPDRHLLPCLCKAADARKPFFTHANFMEARSKGGNVLLFDAKGYTDDGTKSYLAEGVRLGVPTRHLPSKRKLWFSHEEREPAPIWVSVFHREGLRFIRNEAGIKNLTTFHGVYPSLFSANKTDLLFAYLLTDIAKEHFMQQRREYGNGLVKFEPNDLNRSMMLDLSRLSAIDEGQILRGLAEVREHVIAEEDYQAALSDIGEVFLNRYLV